MQKVFFLEMEANFWKNRIYLAEDETIDLIIDLVEERVLLEVKGVPLRKSKYDKVKRDLHNTADSLVQWCSRPFTLVREEASLPKEPIRIRHLPEETSKIEEGYNLEFLDETEPAFVRFYFNRSLVVELIEKNIVVPDSLEKDISGSNWIQFIMDRKDILAIFRAVPNNAYLILRPPITSFRQVRQTGK